MKKKTKRTKLIRIKRFFSQKLRYYFLIIGFLIISSLFFKYFYYRDVLGTSTLQNLLQNGTLQEFNGKQFPNWLFHLQGTAVGTIANDTKDINNGYSSAAINVIKATSSTPWYVQLEQTNVPLSAGRSYQLLFYVKSATQRNIDVLIQETDKPYKTYYKETVQIGPNWSSPKAVEFTMPSSLYDTNVAVRLDLAQTTGTILLNNLSLFQLPNPHLLYFGTEFDNGHTTPTVFPSTVQAEEDKIHHGLAIATTYQGWGSAVNGPFLTQTYEAMRQHGSIPMITWMPGNFSEPLTNQQDYNLESIINGTHDMYINQWALAAKAWGHPFFLRFGHEMNGTWYPWDEAINGNQTGQSQFVKAWKHVFQIFRQDGVTNATWVWCPNMETSAAITSLKELYPGDNYVDWTCIDAYNTDVQPTGWLSFFSMLRPTYEDIISIAPTKPMMIAETGSVEVGGNKPDWITEGFRKDIPYIFPQVYAILYYDLNVANQYPTTYPPQNYLINTSQSSLDAFIRAIQLPIYTSNTFSNIPTGLIDIPGKEIAKPTSIPNSTQSIFIPRSADTAIYSQQIQTFPSNISKQPQNLQVTTGNTQSIMRTSQSLSQEVNPENIQHTAPEQMTPTPSVKNQSINTIVSPILYTAFHPVNAIIQANNAITHTVSNFFLHLLGK